MKRSFTILVISSTLQMIGFAQTPSAVTPGQSPVVLSIDGVKVTSADVDRKHPERLFQARATYYQAERQALDEFVDEYLLERQAEAEKLTVDALLERHVNSTVAKDPPEEILKLYYEIINSPETFEKLRPQIIDRLKQVRVAKAKTAYMQSLRTSAKVTLLLPAPRVDISIKDTPVRGTPSAPVVLVEYADYECPYCQQVQPVLDRVVNEYKDKVVFAFKDVPLPMHANAQKAAEAAHCAEAQGKFWEYHDLLFTSKQLEMSKLKDNARQLKLDGAAFDKCLESGARFELIKSQLKEAEKLGLNGTPTFFINGKVAYGNLTYDQLHQMIEEELAATPAHRASNKP
jgi:protein-disulfide isomerase